MADPNPRHILLVDDDSSFREVFAHTLKGSGYSVTQAEDGHAALQLVTASLNAEGGGALPDDLSGCTLVTDYNMPGMTGADLIAKIQSLGVEFGRTMIISGNAYREEVIDDAKRVGALLFDKSVPFKELVRMAGAEDDPESEPTESDDAVEEPT